MKLGGEKLCGDWHGKSDSNFQEQQSSRLGCRDELQVKIGFVDGEELAIVHIQRREGKNSASSGNRSVSEIPPVGHPGCRWPCPAPAPPSTGILADGLGDLSGPRLGAVHCPTV